MNKSFLAQTIDHTLLKQTATSSDIKKLCEEAIHFNFKTVCVQPFFVNLCKELISEKKIKICTVIGFPLGANTTVIKKSEAQEAILNGASELDMVLNIGMLKEKNKDYLLNEIKTITNTAHEKECLLKVIIETSLLNEDDKLLACAVVSEAGADFIKTSTGFAGGGATIEDVILMKKNCSSNIKIKASGGIKTTNFALELIKAGASRLGTSSGISLINNIVSTDDY